MIIYIIRYKCITILCLKLFQSGFNYFQSASIITYHDQRFPRPRRAWARVAPPLPHNEEARPFLPSHLSKADTL